MAFKFTLATVLRLREIDEEREERLLGQILSQIASTRLELDDLQLQVDNLLRSREQQLQTTTSAAQLQITYGHMRALEVLQKDVAVQIDNLETLRDQQMRIYQNARRNREVVTSLRDQQQAVYREMRKRKEQAQMDDNFAARLARRY
jgi:flagellar FliJ protein